jgi:AraC-like DNA-binding protein
MIDNNLYTVKIGDIPADKIGANYADSDMVLIDIDNAEKYENFEAIKLGFNQFILCYGGKMQVDVDGRTMNLGENQLLVCPSYAVISNLMLNPKLRCVVMCLTDDLLKSVLRSYTDIWNKALYVHKINIINLHDNSIKKLHNLFSLVQEYVEDEYLVFRPAIIHSLLQAALLDLCSNLAYKSEGFDVELKSQSNTLFNRFIDLLTKTEVKRHPGSYYAQELNISTKYLTRICNEGSGKTALAWIKDYINEDISYYMKDPNMNIKMIAHRTGFPNLSAFGKYVRKIYGMSPSEYRRKLIMN